MSLSRDGVWKAGVWATTVWADGVWFEGAQVVTDTHDGFDGAHETHRLRREAKERLREQLKLAAFGPEPVQEVAEEVQAALAVEEAKPIVIDYQRIYNDLMARLDELERAAAQDDEDAAIVLH